MATTLFSGFLETFAQAFGTKSSMVPPLPVELLEHIVSYVEYDDQATLAALCRSSKTFNQITTHLLYQCIGFGEDANMPWSKRNRKLQLLCRTLVENRDLAMYPREMKHFIDECTPMLSMPKVQLPKKKIAVLLDRDMNLADGVAEPILALVTTKKASEEAYFMLLMVICPKVETLTLKGAIRNIVDMQVFGEILDYIETVGEEDTRSDNSYGDMVSHSHEAGIYNIRNLVLDATTGENWPNSALIEGLLRLPGLRKVTTTSLGAGMRLAEPNRYITDIEELVIESCHAEPDDIGDILGNCPSLRSLKIEWMTREKNYRRFDWADLGEHIAGSCSELQHLRINHEHDIMIDDEDYYESFGVVDDDYLRRAHLLGLGFLKDLKSLETLYVSIIALWGTHRDDMFEPNGFSVEDNNEPKHTLSSVLPESLKELTVLCEDKYISREDKGILEDPRAETLENLTIMNCQKDCWISKHDGEGSCPKKSSGLTETRFAASQDRHRVNTQARAWRPDPDHELDGLDDDDEDLIHDELGMPFNPQARARYPQLFADMGEVIDIFPNKVLEMLQRAPLQIRTAMVQSMTRDMQVMMARLGIDP